MAGIVDDGTVLYSERGADEETHAFPDPDIITETQLDDLGDNLLHTIPETQPLPEHLRDQSDVGNMR